MSTEPSTDGIIEAAARVIANAGGVDRWSDAGEPTREDIRNEARALAGVLDVPDIGLVCEDGYGYSICRECCTHGSSYQSEWCATEHDGTCWPCRTIRALDDNGGGS